MIFKGPPESDDRVRAPQTALCLQDTAWRGAPSPQGLRDAGTELGVAASSSSDLSSEGELGQAPE